MSPTRQASEFVAATTLADAPADVQHLAKRSILDGLGLAIARDLSRGMGGDLRAEKNDSGAMFVLSLRKASRPGRS